MNSSTFETAVLPHLDAAYNFARYLTRDPDEAADVVQDAYLRAWRHFGAFRGGDPRAWLLAIVRRTCYTRWRRQRRERDEVDYQEGLHALADEGDAERQLIATETAATVRDTINSLPAVFREVIILRELEGLSYREISEVISAPVGTVMSRLSRARERLIQILPSQLKEDRR